MLFRIISAKCLERAKRYVIKARKDREFCRGRVHFIADGADVGAMDMLIVVSYQTTFMHYKVKAICHVPGSLSTSISTERFLDIDPSSAYQVLVGGDLLYCRGEEYKLVRGLCHAL